MTHKTSVAVSLAAAAVVLFSGLVLYFTQATRAAHPHPLTSVRVFWMAVYMFGTVVSLAMLLHMKPRPRWLKVSAMTWALGIGLVSIYHFAQVNVWLGGGMFAILATLALYRTRTAWDTWWASW